VAGFDRGNEFSRFVKGEGFPDQLNFCQVLKKDVASWS
jgi:hypothetical protein